MALYYTFRHVYVHIVQSKVFLSMCRVWRSSVLVNKALSLILPLTLCVMNFLFQKSFRSKFLFVAELLHGEGFQVSSFSYLKLEFLKLEMYSACYRIDELWNLFGYRKKEIFPSTTGVFVQVVSRASRYHPTESVHDCLIEQAGLTHKFWQEQPWLCSQPAARMSHYKFKFSKKPKMPEGGGLLCREGVHDQ